MSVVPERGMPMMKMFLFKPGESKVSKQPTKSQQIRQMKAENPNMKASEIAQKLNTKLQYVYTTLYLEKKAQKPKKAKKAAVKRRLSVLPPPPKALIINPTSDRIRKLETQIIQFRTVISYLEHQLGLKDSQHGASV